MSWFSDIFKGAGGGIISGIGNIVGGLLGQDAEEDAAAANANLQREFAQSGIQWKVADAKKAGIHPLYALGAQTIAASPSYVGGNSLGQGISDMGQNIGRAVEANLTASERSRSKILEDLVLEKAALENDLLRSQITTVNRAITPPYPSGSISGDIRFDPSVNVSSRRDDASREANRPAPSIKEFVMPDGSVISWPSPDAKQAIEDSLYEYEHMYETRYKPWAARSNAYNFGRKIADFDSYMRRRGNFIKGF